MSRFNSLSSKIQIGFASLVIPLSLLVGYFIYTQILGNPDNFVDQDPTKEPVLGNYLGVIHKGGYIVVLQIAFMVILLTYAIERFITIMRAKGRGSNLTFSQTIRSQVDKGAWQEAQATCDERKGSVANVIRNGLGSFREILDNNLIKREERLSALKHEFDEATHLEIPILHRNMSIISTLASIATLVGLLGTVTGMIKAFAALASQGSADAQALASGISQALVTTALGISTAVVAIVIYNFFASRIDNIIYQIEELSFSVVHALKVQLGLDEK